MSRWSAYRFSAHASALAAAVFFALLSSILLAGPASARTTGLSVKVSPDRGLVDGQVVSVSGSGLTRSAAGNGPTWFITECTASVHGHVNLSTDTPHCDVTDAKAVRVGHDGSFSTRFRVRTGVVGDGYCGTVGHTTCVVGISTAKGQGTVVKISFALKPAPTASTTSTTAA